MLIVLQRYIRHAAEGGGQRNNIHDPQHDERILRENRSGSSKKAAEDCIKYQTDGTMDEYMNAARRLCAEMGVALCDCYDRWQAMKQAGIDTTALLANHINHPSRVMHGMFAGMLLDTMLMH